MRWVGDTLIFEEETGHAQSEKVKAWVLGQKGTKKKGKKGIHTPAKLLNIIYYRQTFKECDASGHRMPNSSSSRP